MGYGQNAVYFFDNSIVTILQLGIRLLWISFTVSIIAGIAVEAKSRGWDKLCVSIFQQLNSYNSPNIHLCTKCGQKLTSDWQYCPGCSSPTKTKSDVEKTEVQTLEEKAPVQKEEIITDSTIKPQDSNAITTSQKPRKRKHSNNENPNSSYKN